MALRMKQAEEMSAEEIDALRLENRRLHRALKHLTGSNTELERLARVVARMNMASPWEAIHHARRLVFGDKYEGDRPCPLEMVMAQRGNAVRLLYAYELLKGPIERQLEEAREAMRRPPLR
jgi:hypothetical protein